MRPRRTVWCSALHRCGLAQRHGNNVCRWLALVRAETMRSRTSVSHAIGSRPFNFAVWISVIAIAQ